MVTKLQITSRKKNWRQLGRVAQAPRKVAILPSPEKLINGVLGGEGGGEVREDSWGSTKTSGLVAPDHLRLKKKGGSRERGKPGMALTRGSHWSARAPSTATVR